MICPHCGRDADALAWNLWLAFQGRQEFFADAYKRSQGMSAEAWQWQMMRQAQAMSNLSRSVDGLSQYQPPVTPPKPWESGWRDKQSEWEKIP